MGRRDQVSANARYGTEGSGGAAAATTPSADMPVGTPPPAAPALVPAPTEEPSQPTTGTDSASALRVIQGDQAGENFGFGGLGATGTGRAGGGTGEGTIGLGNLGTIGHGGGGDDNGNGRGGEAQEHAPAAHHSHAEEDRGGRARGPTTVEPVDRAHAANDPYDAQRQIAQDQAQLGPLDGHDANGGYWRGGTTTGATAEVLAQLNDLTVAGGSYRTSVTTTFTVTTAPVPHFIKRCSDAASLSLDDRRALWTERLARVAGDTSGIADVYRNANRDCELDGWADRRALLELALNVAGGVPAMVQLYRVLDDGSARGYLRSAILRRVHSPDDLRTVRDAFGLDQGVDWTLVEQVLARQTTPEARVRTLRQLLLQYPESFDLKLRLLSELEGQHRLPEAKRLAEDMRADPLADAGVRTAIGEMYVRLGDEDEAKRVFSEIVELAPLDELARRRLGDLYRAHGWFEDAYRQYQTLAQIRPDDPTVSLLLAQAAAGAGRVDEALRLEQAIVETAEPGATDGLARTALLWSSVRFALLRKDARDEHDQAKLDALISRMRRSGVLRAAGALRVSLTWSHPDAQLSLWAAYPGLPLARPTDIAPELGIEALDVQDDEPGTYKVEVRRTTSDTRTAVDAQVVVIWHEGQPDEQIAVLPLHFGQGQLAFAWTITNRTLTPSTPSVPATIPTSNLSPHPAPGAHAVLPSNGGAQ